MALTADNKGKGRSLPLKRTTFKLARLALCARLAFTPASGASAAAVNMPQETVTGSVIYDAGEDKYLSPGMVTVIHPEERKGEQRSLSDLLEDVPGLRVIRLRGRNSYAVASVRGSTSA